MRYKFEATSRDLKELNDHFRGPEYALALYELAIQFRSMGKYHNDEPCSWQTAYEHLIQILQEINIDPLSE